MRTCTYVEEQIAPNLLYGTSTCDVTSSSSPVSVDVLALSAPLYGLLFMVVVFFFVSIFRRQK